MNLIEAHPALCALAGLIVFSSVVTGMPTPDEKSSFAYRWAYTSLHILSFTATEAMKAKYPTLPNGIAAAEQTTTTTVVSK